MKKILIIEDNDTCTLLIRVMLKKIGIDNDSIIFKENGDDIMELLKNDDIGLILLDLTIPGGKSGRELLVDIRKVSDVPIIIETAQTSFGVRDEMMKLGANDYLSKPYSSDEFGNVIRKYL